MLAREEVLAHAITFKEAARRVQKAKQSVISVLGEFGESANTLLSIILFWCQLPRKAFQIVLQHIHYLRLHSTALLRRRIFTTC